MTSPAAPCTRQSNSASDTRSENTESCLACSTLLTSYTNTCTVTKRKERARAEGRDMSILVFNMSILECVKSLCVSTSQPRGDSFSDGGRLHLAFPNECISRCAPRLTASVNHIPNKTRWSKTKQTGGSNNLLKQQFSRFFGRWKNRQTGTVANGNLKRVQNRVEMEWVLIRSARIFKGCSSDL